MPTEHHVLVVDHDSDSARRIADVLHTLPGRKVRCSSAENATSAQAIGSKSPDIVLLIVAHRAPDAHARELIPVLKQLCPGAECIVIRADDALHATADLDNGVLAYLEEPLAPPTLLRFAETALTKVELMRERDRLRAELVGCESRRSDLLAAIPGLVIGTDGEGRITSWNQRLEELTGRSCQEMLGTMVKEIVGSGGERRLTMRDGSQRLVRWQLSQVPGVDGKQLTYAFGTDVTEERGRLRRTLRAERLAAVGTLATGLAHEIRNPLNSAALQLQVLRRRLAREEKGADKLVPVIETVDAELFRLERLVSDFLAFARPNPLQLETTLVSRLLESVAEQVRPDAEKTGVSIRIEASSPEEPVEADRERLRQVLCNLTRNAVEAMPDGGVVTLRVRGTDSEGFVAIDVEDTGAGIPEHAPIFDAFFTTKQGGTGLGLAIVHRIVEDHGGSVQYESKPGFTRFTVELPAVLH